MNKTYARIVVAWRYPDPYEMYDTYGADAMRWFLLSSAILRGSDLIVTEQGIRDSVRQVILPLWNAWYFFSLYASAESADFQARHRTDQTGVLVIEHVLASSALPLIFPAVHLGNEWYGDGGIRLTAPLSPALHLDRAGGPAPGQLPSAKQNVHAGDRAKNPCRRRQAPKALPNPLLLPCRNKMDASAFPVQKCPIIPEAVTIH